MNFVLDTHVWISIFSNQQFEKNLIRLTDNRLRIYSFSEQLKEFADVHNKHPKISKMLPLKTQDYVNALRLTSFQIETVKNYRLLNDYKDNYRVDLSNVTKSTLVSNDKGFGILKKLHSTEIRVISIVDFYEYIGL
ncbi:MAG: putative toxin-antitoxin system toxin component, PIN family [Bacteroidia bacterium]